MDIGALYSTSLACPAGLVLGQPPVELAHVLGPTNERGVHGVGVACGECLVRLEQLLEDERKLIDLYRLGKIAIEPGFLGAHGVSVECGRR